VSLSLDSIWTGPFRPFQYWADLAENEPDFLIDGMLHSATNTVSGKPTVGKTRLVAAMAAAIASEDSEFCGSEIVGAGQVMVICTDAGETRRWGLIELRPDSIEFDPCELYRRPCLRLTLNTPNLGSFFMVMTPTQAQSHGAAFTDYCEQVALKG
jgi:hypothetical protein